MNVVRSSAHARCLFLFSVVLLIFAFGCASTPDEPEPLKLLNPLELMELKYMPTHGVKTVGSAFLAKTAEWREYVNGLEKVSWERVETHGDQVLYYLEGDAVKMTWDPEKSGKPESIQYYRDGFMYVLISDFDDDGLTDARQYYVKGNVKYIEAWPGKPSSVWWECSPAGSCP